MSLLQGYREFGSISFRQRVRLFRGAARRNVRSGSRAVKLRVSVCSPKSPQIADMVRSAFHHSANPLVLQITAF